MNGAEKKLPAALCAILIPGLAIHKFILGYTTTALVQIALTILTCGIFHIVSIIEGIIYLTKSDEEFVQTYVVGQKHWF